MTPPSRVQSKIFTKKTYAVAIKIMKVFPSNILYHMVCLPQCVDYVIVTSSITCRTALAQYIHGKLLHATLCYTTPTIKAKAAEHLQTK